MKKIVAFGASSSKKSTTDTSQKELDELTDLKISFEKLEKRYNNLIDRHKRLKSKIKPKTINFSKYYVLDIDEVEYLELIQ